MATSPIISINLTETSDITNTSNLFPYTFTDCEHISYQMAFTSAAATAKNFADTDVDVTENAVTIASHGLATGRKGQLTSTGTLPDPLLTGTDYFIINIDADTIKFATSLANAEAGTAIDLTDQGTAAATHTFTPTAIAGASVKLQKSSGTDAGGTELWSDEVGVTGQDVVTANITASATINLCKQFITGRKYRVQVAITAGELTVSGTCFAG